MKICLFDIDGTLVDTAGAGSAAMVNTFADEFGTDRHCRGVPFAGRTDRSIVSDMFLLHDIEDTPEHWKRFYDRFVRYLPESLAAHSGRVLPGIHPLLQRLADSPAHELGLLTGNLKEGARLKLRHYELHHYFWREEEVLGGFGDEHHCRDDVAAVALASIRQNLGDHFHPRRSWVLGDTPSDVQCARAINANAVAVATGMHTVEQLSATDPDILLPDFTEPTPLLRSIEL